MKWLLFFVLFVCFGALSFGFVDSTKLPVDTIPPRVSITPLLRSHAAPFSVTLTCNEPGSISYSVNKKGEFIPYSKPFYITTPGRTIVYFRGQDFFSNTSTIDSQVYVLDLQPLTISVEPQPGVYRKPVVIRVRTNKPAQVFFNDSRDQRSIPVFDSVVVYNKLHGIFSANDSAGNHAQTSLLQYRVDTTEIQIVFKPGSGTYNKIMECSFQTENTYQIYYTSDPIASLQQFVQYQFPFQSPYGLSLFRYYVASNGTKISKIMSSRIIIDTLPPNIRFVHIPGKFFDTVALVSQEKCEIFYGVGKKVLRNKMDIYSKPLVLQRVGTVVLASYARDSAGNISRDFVWQKRYDTIAPVVTVFPKSGVYSHAVDVVLKTSKPGDIYYTLDGSIPNLSSPIFTDTLVITKQGKTTLTSFCVDNADNRGKMVTVEYVIDRIKPSAKADVIRIRDSTYGITLKISEPGMLYYSFDPKASIKNYVLYESFFTCHFNQFVSYYAVDKAGNMSELYTLFDSRVPITTLTPPAGAYNHRVIISSQDRKASELFLRFLPDTTFVLLRDSLPLSNEGIYHIEYYSITKNGIKSTIQRAIYLLDWTVPKVRFRLRKSTNDSIEVFFSCSENATFYYTLDGSNPLYSKNVFVAGNKFNKSSDHLIIPRSDLKMSWYVEDKVGNRSSVSMFDCGKPDVYSSVYSENDRVYNQILSIALGTSSEQSHIYFERHNKIPTVVSQLYREPLILLASDTIKAFAVDVSGIQGDVTTFIYSIDLPPNARLNVKHHQPMKNEPVLFDATESFDQETDLKSCVFQWDFNGDSEPDTVCDGCSIQSYTFQKPGMYTSTVIMADSRKQKDTASKKIFVIDQCPEAMVFVPQPGNNSFCIDKYEWSKSREAKPASGVTYTYAAITCYDNVKRLCTSVEWEAACTLSTVNQIGIADMKGNVLEWIYNEHTGEPIHSVLNSCGGAAEKKNSIKASEVYTSRNHWIGFRCCK